MDIKGRCSRRDWLQQCGLMAGGFVCLTDSTMITSKKIKTLWDPFTPEEKEIIENSAMAQDMANLMEKGYSCAELSLLVSLHYIDRPENEVYAAAGFGGGMGHDDLCGLLTGGIMGIGFAAGNGFEDSRKRDAFVKRARNTYWDWWADHVPLHCKDLNPLYHGREEYLWMCQRVAAKLESLIQPAV